MTAEKPKSNQLLNMVKQRLTDGMAVNLDAIGYVEADLRRLAGADFEPQHTKNLIDEKRGQPKLPRESNLVGDINAFYDHQFYARDSIFGMLLGDTEFRNIGYWDETTPDQNAAAEKLQDKLLEMIPEKVGTILDVACGMGVSTKRLLDYYPASCVSAINISEKQIESTRRNAPGVDARVMSAVEMTFAEDSFDNIICIEAAFHFQTRRKFFDDARRILKDGGRLVLSDTLFTSAERLTQSPIFPGVENHVQSPEAYRNLLEEVGFRNVIVQDVSDKVWKAHFMYVVNKVHQHFFEGELSLVQLTEILWSYYSLYAITGSCVFASAQK